MSSIYNPTLVALSVLVAVFSSYTALELTGRIAAAPQASVRRLWLMAGAVTMGAGVWSMHFIGLLAFDLPVNFKLDFAAVIFSNLIAIAGCGLALWLASQATLSRPMLLLGGTVMGGCICAMHFTDLQGMHGVVAVGYEPLLYLCSVLISVTASIAAVRMAYTLRGQETPEGIRSRMLAAAVLGMAISGVHYIGMAATRFTAEEPAASGLQAHAAAFVIAASVLVLVGIILGIAIFNSQLGARTAQLLHQLEGANLDLHNEIAAKVRAEELLRKSEQHFRSAFEDAPIGMALTDTTGRFLRVNAAMCQMLGYTQEELLAIHLKDLTHPDDLPLAMQALMQAVAGKQRIYRLEKRYLHKDGRIVWARLNVSLVADADGSISHTVGQVMDITESRQQNARILRLNRVHALLSGISSSIVRVHSRPELFAQAATLAVEQGGFVFAWAGMVNEHNDIEPVAWAGPDRGYLEQIRPLLAGSTRNTPSSETTRKGKPIVVNNFATDPLMAAAKDAALSRGFQSLASLPLMVRGQLVATFNLYSSETGFFDDEEMHLLNDLTRDISYALELIAREEEMNYLAYYDTLTGLANRTLFLERVAEGLLMARKTVRQLAVAVVDLDHFKSVNDAWGQVTGDEVLKKVAERLTGFAGGPALLSRISADRFAIMLPETDQFSSLKRHLSEGALGVLEQPLTVFGQELRLSARIGLAVFPVDGEDAESLLKNAESALKNAKRGDEHVCFYTHHLSATVRQRMNVENKLRRALKEREFLLHYQPKVDLASGRVTGVEALIRWDSRDMGLVPPLQFVPLLEETGMIRDVGKWIIEEAAATYRGWCASMSQPPRIAVNVSPVQLKQADFVPFLREAVAGGGIDIEVTESMMMENPDLMFGKLHEIRAMGVKVGIDDFGTGYSSLSYLSRLPADTLKVDRSFVIKMSDSAVNVSLVATIISMAHSLNLKVTAEGVDSAEQLKFLRMLKCDEIQGYLFSKPVAADQVQAAINRLAMHPLLLNSAAAVNEAA